MRTGRDTPQHCAWLSSICFDSTAVIQTPVIPSEVEGPFLVDGSTEKVPPLRLAALGSGRDDARHRNCFTAASTTSAPIAITALPSEITIRPRPGVSRPIEA